MDKLLEFSHLHLWVRDVDAFKRLCERTLGWRAIHYAPGIVVTFDELPSVAFEHGEDSRLQLGVKSIDARADARTLEAQGIAPMRPLEAKAGGRVQAWFRFDGKVALELEEDWNSITLVAPDARYRASFLEAVHEFQAEGRMKDVDVTMDAEGFDAYLAGLSAQRHARSRDRVPNSTWWGVCNGEYLGTVSLRHELNPWLGQMGGHVGYQVRSKFRNKGIARAMVRALVPHLRTLGLPQALITCDEGNEASRKVAEACGARYVGKFSPADGSVAKLHFVLEVR